MIYVLTQYWLPLLLALLAGVAVGWWYAFPTDIRNGRAFRDMD